MKLYLYWREFTWKELVCLSQEIVHGLVSHMFQFNGYSLICELSVLIDVVNIGWETREDQRKKEAWKSWMWSLNPMIINSECGSVQPWYPKSVRLSFLSLTLLVGFCHLIPHRNHLCLYRSLILILRLPLKKKKNNIFYLFSLF